MSAKEKYDEIGKGYDQTRLADPYLLSWLIAHLDPSPNKQYLDVGCGTGNYTTELMKMGYNVIGMDPSAHMLDQAMRRYPTGQWLQGAAEHTNQSASSIDGILCTLTIHHWQNLTAAFNELHRVLKPGGRLVIFTSTAAQMEGYWLNAYFPQMLDDSIMQMPDFEYLQNALQSAGFTIDSTEKYFVRDDLQDHFLYCGKHRPQLYLNEKVRNGISSFSDLANQDEVREGLNKLAEDIESKQIQEIIAQYENDLGDYLFVVATKQPY